jgi:hypothetical protein
MDDDRIQKARKILLHENFPKLTPDQVQDVYRNLIIQGITKEEISQILHERENKEDVIYLETLPYNVFVNLVLVGEIKGKDLLNFCHSSPLINEKCNKPFVSESGHIVPQYIFSELLEQMGIPPRDNPREQYTNLIQHKAFYSFKHKLVRLSEWHQNIVWRINTLWHLLYNSPSFVFDFLPKILKLYPKALDFQLINMLIAKIDGLNTYGYRTKDMIRTILEGIKNTIDHYKSKGFKASRNLNYSYLGYRSIEKYITEKEFSDANEIFAQVLAKTLKDNNFTNKDFREFLKTEWKRHIPANYILDLTEDELDYLTFLHYKVITGEIPVLEKFDYYDLIKYE